MMKTRKDDADQSPKVHVRCPRCNSLEVKEDSVGVFVELLCLMCGARSYHDLKVT